MLFNPTRFEIMLYKYKRGIPEADNKSHLQDG